MKKSIAAGFIISIGAAIYLTCANKFLGTFMFTLGLFTICTFDLNLFTGKIGYVLKNKNNPNCALIWLGNLIGCFCGSALVRIAKPELQQIAYDMIQNKMSGSIISIIILGFFCGVLMYIAVENYKHNMNNFAKIIGLFLCVAGFMFAGFEHSIADMCYCIIGVNSPILALDALVFILIVSVSNGLGSIACRYLTIEET